jgi:hypothetical protein
MNCEPNDLAMVVRSTTNSPCVLHHLGRPVTVRERFDSSLGPAWRCGPTPEPCPVCGGTTFGFLDADLQALRESRHSPCDEPGWRAAVEAMDDMAALCDLARDSLPSVAPSNAPSQARP